ncbi:2-hydroxyacid dehydrogenase [Flavobacteriaceae bacterium TP-CH-4]|uniref:2-hydroxyacid dehydrogenase n=1 Tax=Pelagihabitans pacificus TaxID=2696054 RepID=A0A967EBY6_9FLAO|nr:2-hydroxyacid dehydrogenase [Pelagihabitans pacificus]NHF57723.1 2-hydroxyacid dehydrogenase [Pelagihabitans pacificus]
MKLLVYSAKDYEIPFLGRANKNLHKVSYTKDALDSHTAIQAMGYKAISIFSGDDASLVVLEKLWDLGVRYITLRSAGYNNIHIKAAKRFGFKVANAPEYSPHAIAEHAVALLLALNRKLVLAATRVRNYNFLQEGLMGVNLYDKTVGVIGTGRIGSVMVKILYGFGCKILACDLVPNTDLVKRYDVTYTDLEVLCKKSDVISLHIPLTYENYYLINKRILALMKQDAILVNTARGAIVETKALIHALENGKIGGYCTDVYEREKGTFYRDHSKRGLEDEQLKKLLSFPNILLTPHHAYMTKEALTNIAEITFYNIDCWEEGKKSKNELGYETIVSS